MAAESVVERQGHGLWCGGTERDAIALSLEVPSYRNATDVGGIVASNLLWHI